MSDAIDVLFVSRRSFHVRPQRGTPKTVTWDELAKALSRPTYGVAKDEAGGYALGKYADNVRRKTNLERIGALVIDVDEGGEVTHVSNACAHYRAIVHETFSSTVHAPRCRLLIGLTEPIDAKTYEAVHVLVRQQLRAAGIIADEGAKDASRLSYMPVRRRNSGYQFRQVDGATLDAQALLAVQPPAEPRRFSPPPIHNDRYINAALRRAASLVANASHGGRHHELSRQAWSLARLELDEVVIRAALLEPFVGAAGESRRHEGERTIRDAVAAKRVQS